MVWALCKVQAVPVGSNFTYRRFAFVGPLCCFAVETVEDVQPRLQAKRFQRNAAFAAAVRVGLYDGRVLVWAVYSGFALIAMLFPVVSTYLGVDP